MLAASATTFVDRASGRRAGLAGHSAHRRGRDDRTDLLAAARASGHPAVEGLLGELSNRLGLRRRVRLKITQDTIGPAVVGLWRPTIVLPEVVVRGTALHDLEPILAHELLHIRRGDLWVSGSSDSPVPRQFPRQHVSSEHNAMADLGFYFSPVRRHW